MKFSEKGAGGGGQRPFGNFPEIHPFWCGQASLRIGCDLCIFDVNFGGPNWPNHEGLPELQSYLSQLVL